MRTILGWLTAWSLALAANSVYADSSPRGSGPGLETEPTWRQLQRYERPRRDEPAEVRWYGWQTLAADGIAALLVVGGTQFRANPDLASVLAPAGAVTFVFATPALHLIHGRWGAAIGSYSLRATPLLLLLGSTLCGLQRPFAETPHRCSELVTLAAISAILPIILDPAWLAYEKVKPRESRVQVAPWFATESAGLILGGRY